MSTETASKTIDSNRIELTALSEARLRTADGYEVTPSGLFAYSIIAPDQKIANFWTEFITIPQGKFAVIYIIKELLYWEFDRTPITNEELEMLLKILDAAMAFKGYKFVCTFPSPDKEVDPVHTRAEKFLLMWNTERGAAMSKLTADEKIPDKDRETMWKLMEHTFDQDNDLPNIRREAFQIEKMLIQRFGVD